MAFLGRFTIDMTTPILIHLPTITRSTTISVGNNLAKTSLSPLRYGHVILLPDIFLAPTAQLWASLEPTHRFAVKVASLTHRQATFGFSSHIAVMYILYLLYIAPFDLGASTSTGSWCQRELRKVRYSSIDLT